MALIQLLENKYVRWIKTKPKSLDRHQEVVRTIEKFIGDGRLIVVKEDKQSDKTNSDANNEKNQSVNEMPTSETSSIEVERFVKLPGVPIEVILASSFAKRFLNSKGLSPEDCVFFEEISTYVLKAIRKDSLARLYINDGKNKSIDTKEDKVIKDKLYALSRVGALKPGVKHDTLVFNPGWLEELEKGYDEFITKNQDTEGVTAGDADGIDET
ncbi:9401_t:CDS:1, partial [Acaulospora morrowiae]